MDGGAPWGINMKRTAIIFWLILLMDLFLTGCHQNNSIQNTNTAPLTGNDKIEEKSNENSKIVNPPEIREDKGIFVDTLTIGNEEEFKGKVTKNKLTKTANIDFSYYINDSSEKADLSGSEVYMAPMLVNMLCKLFPMAFYDPEGLENLTNTLNEAINEINKENQPQKVESEKREDNEILNKLEGYIVSNVVLTFYDMETNEKIAECSSKGKDDLSFKVYREYDPEKSFFGAKIGVFEEK